MLYTTTISLGLLSYKHVFSLAMCLCFVVDTLSLKPRADITRSPIQCNINSSRLKGHVSTKN